MSSREDLDAECAVCEEVTEHSIVHIQKGIGREGLEYTLRCNECGHVQKKMMEEEKLIEAAYVLSDEGISSKGRTKLFSDEIVSTGEEIYLGDKRGIVTAVDTKEGRRSSARADDVVTIWAKSLGRKLVRVSVNRGSKTLSVKVEAEPEEEFSIGDIIGTDMGDAVITKIKTSGRMVERGGAEAKDIVRVYAKMMRESFDRKSRALWNQG